MNEYDLIRGLFGRDVPDLFASDAQFFATGGGEWGVTCDAFCAEDDGFDPRDPRLFAANVVRGTLSDLAASGCEPAFFLQAVSFPRGASAAWLGSEAAAGILKGTITGGQAVKLWIVCWIGNLCGGIVLGIVYHLTGLGAGAVGEFMAAGALAKMSAAPVALIARGALCNMLVCLAVWCGFRCKNEAAKLMMVFWCLFAFITTGFEHSIANMTLFTEVLLNPAGQAVSLGGAVYNLVMVTIGNMIGGIVFVALPYCAASKEQ